MKNLRKHILLQVLFIAFATTCLTSCDNNDSPGSTTPLTVEEVKAKIIGQWESDEMTLTFMPNNVVNIKHDEIIRESPYESLYVGPCDYSKPYMIRQGEKRIEILIGHEDNYWGYEYMYVRTINNKTLSIEFYGKGITFKLTRTGNFEVCSTCDGTGEQTCYACDGAGGESIIYGCYSCNGSGERECSYCWGDGERYDYYQEEYVPCEYCDETGRWFCSSCGGTGSWGSDWDDCNSCWGTGTKGYCYDCNGDGYNITPVK